MIPESKRYFIELAYHGAAYHGWQTQPNAITVQEVLDAALSTFFRETVSTLGCGRTDTGVHAAQFFAHFDLNLPIDMKREKEIIYRLNGLLPFDIAVNGIKSVPAEAHARFDALSRTYEYRIHFGKQPFLNGLSWQQRSVPDMLAMNDAARLLKEYCDFSSFSKSNTQVFTNNCCITEALWVWKNDYQLVFRITADRFLRNMVRAIVGTLLEIGWMKLSVEDMRRIIESRDRSIAGVSVPACGLYLTEVSYPSHLSR
ncbi:tRNA pseudouridine38-40 synthase [bacterium A37T11]|nr:tRNA pseudouridine38-40 synthase [bacterium A37T11]